MWKQQSRRCEDGKKQRNLIKLKKNYKLLTKNKKLVRGIDFRRE